MERQFHTSGQHELLQIVAPLEESAQLRRALNSLFPANYIETNHKAGSYESGIFNARVVGGQSGQLEKDRGDLDSSGTTTVWEASSEPATRTHVINLTKAFENSLDEHRAKPFGLCPIRRAIHDQCFGEFRQTASQIFATEISLHKLLMTPTL